MPPEKGLHTVQDSWVWLYVGDVDDRPCCQKCLIILSISCNIGCVWVWLYVCLSQYRDKKGTIHPCNSKSPKTHMKRPGGPGRIFCTFVLYLYFTYHFLNVDTYICVYALIYMYTYDLGSVIHACMFIRVRMIWGAWLNPLLYDTRHLCRKSWARSISSKSSISTKSSIPTTHKDIGAIITFIIIFSIK